MDEFNLNNLSTEETTALIIRDPVAYFRMFMSDGGESFDVFTYGCSKHNINGITLAVVDEEGGYEGGGEHVERVISIGHSAHKPIAYVRIVGYYASYAGTEWCDEVTRVYPREVVVTQYFETEE